MFTCTTVFQNNFIIICLNFLKMGRNKVKKNNHDITISELETPLKWINELPELELTVADLSSIEHWLHRHCSTSETTKQTICVQPCKLLARACIQICVECTSKNCGTAQASLNWLSVLRSEYAAQFSVMNIDPESLTYIVDAMKLCVKDLHTRNCDSNSDCGYEGSLSDLQIDFKLLSKPTQNTVRCLQSVKLLFYSTLYFPLGVQEHFAKELCIPKSKNPMDEYLPSSELTHQYVRILRRIRHQSRNETLGIKAVIPWPQELTWINKALKLDPKNHKIKTTLYELLYDFVQIKTKITYWTPFEICGQQFTTCEQIVRFLDEEIRELLPHHSESIRLKNLATKLNICKLYREIFTDRESQFGFRGVDRSLQLNSDSSSANWLIGQRDIHYGNYDKAIRHFKTAMEAKPLSPKYTLTYLRALVASVDVEKFVGTRCEMVPIITQAIQDKILFGILHKWAPWNIRHMQFLIGLMNWISDGAFKEWLRFVGYSKFLEQFNYLSPFGMKILMLPTEGSAVTIEALINHCTKLKHLRDTTLSEYDFITSLRNFLSQRFGQQDHKSRARLDHWTGNVYNELYSRNLRPVKKLIKIKKNEEILLSPTDWLRLQEKRLIAEIDQGKRIEKQAWYNNKIKPENTYQIKLPYESGSRIHGNLTSAEVKSKNAGSGKMGESSKTGIGTRTSGLKSNPDSCGTLLEKKGATEVTEIIASKSLLKKVTSQGQQTFNVNVVPSKVKRGIKFVKKESEKKVPKAIVGRIGKRENKMMDFDFSIAN